MKKNLPATLLAFLKPQSGHLKQRQLAESSTATEQFQKN